MHTLLDCCDFVSLFPNDNYLKWIKSDNGTCLATNIQIIVHTKNSAFKYENISSKVSYSPGRVCMLIRTRLLFVVCVNVIDLEMFVFVRKKTIISNVYSWKNKMLVRAGGAALDTVLYIHTRTVRCMLLFGYFLVGFLHTVYCTVYFTRIMSVHLAKMQVFI